MMYNKKLIYLIVIVIIVLFSITTSFIWTVSYSNAKKIIGTNNYNINAETETKVEAKTDVFEPEVIMVHLEDQKIQEQQNIVQNNIENSAVKSSSNNEKKLTDTTNTAVVVQPTFKEVNETVYATDNVNVRIEPSVSSNKVGVLKKGQSVKRTGIGSNGWDRVIYNNTVRYINNTYLSKQKIEEEIINTDKNNNRNNNNNNNNSKVTNSSVDTTIVVNRNKDEWVNEFNKKIEILKREFPDGYYWNHVGSSTIGTSVTRTPCNNKANGLRDCNQYKGKSVGAYGRSNFVQCAGFASMLSDRIFGKDAEIKIFYDYDEIRIGDQARINNNTHTVFIIDKTDEYVVVAECNADFITCKISWGRKIPRSKMDGFYFTRLP